MNILEEHNLVGHVSADPKRVVIYLIAAIFPATLQETLRAHQEVFKHLTNNVVVFLK